MEPFNVEAAKQKMKDALDAYASAKANQFCKHFTLIASFAGWSWANTTIDFDSVNYHFNENIRVAKQNIDKFTANDFMGKNVSTNVSCGRINLVVIYYINSDSVMASVTADIA